KQATYARLAFGRAGHDEGCQEGTRIGRQGRGYGKGHRPMKWQQPRTTCRTQIRQDDEPGARIGDDEEGDQGVTRDEPAIRSSALAKSIVSRHVWTLPR